MRTKIYFRSLERSLTTEDVIRENIFLMLEKFDKLTLSNVVVRVARVKGGNIFKFPRFMCEVLLNNGRTKIVIKKKSDDLKQSIIDSRFALEKAIRRSLSKDVTKKHHVIRKQISL